MIGRVEADLLGEGEAQNHARLRVVGQALAGGRIDQFVEIGQAAQCLAGDGRGVGGVGWREAARGGGGAVERLALAQDGIKHDEGRTARGGAVRILIGAWHGAPYASSGGL